MIEPRRGGSPAAFGLVPLFGTILLLWLLLWGCGIPSAGFIGPPGESSLREPLSSPRLTFEHNVAANSTEDFKGYELYYRFYDAAADTDYEQDRQKILAEPVQPGPRILESEGYRRVVRASADPVADQEPPLIDVPPESKGDEFEVALSFEPVLATDPAEAEASWLGLQAPLARSGASDESQAPKGFLLGSYLNSDDDVEQINREIEDVIFDSELYMALYALGYGIDGLAFDQIYSTPKFLGYFRLQPDQ